MESEKGSRKKPQKWITSQRLILVTEILFIFAVAFFYAVLTAEFVNFFPVHGDFQNFNPVRRFLSGQIPYRDFEDYLGLGHLYLGTALTGLLGGTYRWSLVAFTFLTVACLLLVSLILGKVILKKDTIAAPVTFIVFAVLLSDNIGNFCDIDMWNALKSGLSVGYSARFVRGLILPLCVIVLLIFFRFYFKSRAYTEKKRFYDKIPYIFAGIMAGFSFIWSNDYGISCFICILLSVLIVSFSQSRSVKTGVKAFLLALGVSLVSIFLFLEIFTLGNAGNWFKSTFGTGNYQQWYFGAAGSSYLYEIDLNYLTIFQGIVSIYYFARLFFNKGNRESMIRYGIPGFMNLVCYRTINEYYMLSDRTSRKLNEVAYTVLFFTVLFEVLGYILPHIENLTKAINFTKIGLAVCLLLFLVKGIPLAYKDFGFMSRKYAEYTHFDTLGGYMTYLDKDVRDAIDFIDGQKIFSTYSSAVEAETGQFQPSGYDYIIHVLSDERREKYLESFEEGNFKYAVTISKNGDTRFWEYRAERSNCFFYRELYSKYHKVYSNAYQVYWEKNKVGKENVISGDYELEVTKISENETSIILQTNPDINGIADVYIDYSVEKSGDLSSMFLLREALQVLDIVEYDTYKDDEDNICLNFLRAASSEYVPMYIRNGKGQIILSSKPAEDTLLNINSAVCDRIILGEYF